MRTDATKESVQYMETIAEKRVGPGILMLTSSMQLLYRDRRSWELCAQINKHQSGKAANGVLPPAVADLCVKIMKAVLSAGVIEYWQGLGAVSVAADRRRSEASHFAVRTRAPRYNRQPTIPDPHHDGRNRTSAGECDRGSQGTLPFNGSGDAGGSESLEGMDQQGNRE